MGLVSGETAQRGVPDLPFDVGPRFAAQTFLRGTLTMNGLSTNRRCTSAAACLIQNGIEFVVRYYSETTKQSQKRLLPEETQALHAAGLRIAVVYQDRQTQVEDFSRASGERDGQFAFAYARENGQPLGTTIFFAVDYDAKPADRRAIHAYFQGVAAGLAAAAQGESSYQVGVYGSGYVCRQLKEAALVTHTWLAESTGYRESASYADWTLRQFVTDEELCVSRAIPPGRTAGCGQPREAGPRMRDGRDLLGVPPRRTAPRLAAQCCLGAPSRTTSQPGQREHRDRCLTAVDWPPQSELRSAQTDGLRPESPVSGDPSELGGALDTSGCALWPSESVEAPGPCSSRRTACGVHCVD